MRYLIIQEDDMFTSKEITEEIKKGFQAGVITVVDMEKQKLVTGILNNNQFIYKTLPKWTFG